MLAGYIDIIGVRHDVMGISILTMKKVVPAGMVASFHGMSLVLTRGRQIGMTVQKRRISLTRAVIYGTFSSTRHFSHPSPSG